MADNATSTDHNGQPVPFRTRERGGVHTGVQQAAFQEEDGSEAIVRPDKPLPSADAAAAAKLDTIVSALAALLAELGAKTEPGQTQAVSAAALPLPADAASETTLAAVRDRLPATAHAQPLTDAQLRAVAVPISADALPLPAGAATEAKLSTVDNSLDAIANALVLIADLLPRVNSLRQVAVAIESGSVGIAASQTLATLSDMQRVGGQYVNGYALNAAGLTLIYNQIEVT